MTARADVLTVGVADLLSRPGNARHEELSAVLDGLEVLGSHVPDGAPVTLDLELQSVNDGIVVKGTVSAPWTGECRRCLNTVDAVLTTDVMEIFEDEPVDGETRKLDHDRIDLEPVAREAVLLELPLAPLCKDDCAGLCAECGADRNAVDCGHGVDVVDERWSALGDLKFEE
ncbi:MAG: hypothetical protein JWN67_448 [Actinomycetia bacterium]|nr:hypothetical protein [Actinomycetes bacterium]